MIVANSSRRSGTSSEIGSPTASVAGYPYSFSAPAFQKRITPPNSARSDRRLAQRVHASGRRDCHRPARHASCFPPYEPVARGPLAPARSFRHAKVSSAARANPNNKSLASEVQTVFQGTTLPGLLLEAYGFSLVGEIMLWEAIASFVLAGLAILVTFGYRHAAHERSPASLAGVRFAEFAFPLLPRGGRCLAAAQAPFVGTRSRMSRRSSRRR